MTYVILVPADIDLPVFITHLEESNLFDGLSNIYDKYAFVWGVGKSRNVLIYYVYNTVPKEISYGTFKCMCIP